MESGKVGASRHNARTTPLNNPSPGSKTPQTPHHGGGGHPETSYTDDVVLDNHQSINHNHCPLDDCEPFTEHRYPRAVLRHVEHFFLFEDDGKALTRYGPDIMNKAVAIMRIKIEREHLMDWCEKIGAYFRSQCEKVLNGANITTGADHEKARARLKDHRPKKEDTRDKWARDHVRRFGR
jgi:hypothetical protein